VLRKIQRFQLHNEKFRSLTVNIRQLHWNRYEEN